MEEEKEDYGFATIGVGTTNEKVRIENWISAYYKDGRKFTIVRLENENLALTIENHETSDRNTRQEMLLTQESFFSMYATMCLHMLAEGVDLEEVFNKATQKGGIDYACTPNLKLH